MQRVKRWRETGYDAGEWLSIFERLDARVTLSLVSGISALHLTFEVAARENAPFAPVGDWLMALLAGGAFLAAELYSIGSVASRHRGRKILGLLTYALMMIANGIIQTAYYAQADTFLIKEGLGGWLIVVGIGMGLQYAAWLDEQEQMRLAEEQGQRDAETKRREAEEQARLDALAEAERLRLETSGATERREAREHELALKKLELDAKVQLKHAEIVARPPVSDSVSLAREAPRIVKRQDGTTGKQRAFEALDHDPSLAFRPADLAQAAGMQSEGGARKYIGEWRRQQKVVEAV